MSDASESGEPSALTGAAILLIAAGVMLLAGIAAWLYIGRGASIDGVERLQRHFGAAPAKLGMEVRAAQRLPDGVEVVALHDPAREDVAAAVAPAAGQVDRSKVDLGPAGTAPREALFVFVSEAAWPAVRKEHFERVRWKELAEVPASGGVQSVDEGKLAWRGWDAAYVHERAWDGGSGFRDAIRVDVSLPGQPASLLLIWPRGARADRAALSAWLERLAP